MFSFKKGFGLGLKIGFGLGGVLGLGSRIGNLIGGAVGHSWICARKTPVKRLHFTRTLGGSSKVTVYSA